MSSVVASRTCWVGLIFLPVEGQQIVLKDFVEQHRAHLLDALFRQVALLGGGGPGHHVDVGVVLFIVEGGVPSKITW